MSEESSPYQLPTKPFIIRYLLAPPIPFIPKGYDPLRATCPISEHLWETARPQGIRTIHLAAYVHSHYKFESFQLETLFPFDIHSLLETKTPPLAVPAELTKFRPRLAEAVGCRPTSSCKIRKSLGALRKIARVQEINASIDLEAVPAGLSHEGDSYKTEDRCIVCSHKWGEYCERLGRLFLLRKLELQGISIIKNKRLCLLEQSAQVLVQLAESELLRNEEALRSCLAPAQPMLFYRYRRTYKCLYILLSDLTTECLGCTFIMKCNQRLPLSLLSALEHSCLNMQKVLEIMTTRKNGYSCPLIKNMQNCVRKLFNLYGKKRRHSAASKVAAARVNTRFMGERRRLFDLDTQNEKIHPNLRGFGSTIQIALSILFRPMKAFSHGVYDRVFSPTLVTGVKKGSFFTNRSFLSHKLNYLGRIHLESDADPEAMEYISSSLDRKSVNKNHHSQIPDQFPQQEVLNRNLRLERVNERTNNRANNNRENFLANRQLRGRGINLMLVVCELLGWELNERNAPIIDKTILRAAQLLSNSLALSPLLFSLLARWIMWITPNPYDYYLNGDPSVGTGKKLRYLS